MKRSKHTQDTAALDGREPAVIDSLCYIAEITGELAALAGSARQPMLTYFLNMARVEAEMQINERAASQIPTPPGRRNRGL